MQCDFNLCPFLAVVDDMQGNMEPVVEVSIASSQACIHTRGRQLTCILNYFSLHTAYSRV